MRMQRWMTGPCALAVAAFAVLFAGCGGGGGGGGLPAGAGNNIKPSTPSGTTAVIGREGGEVVVAGGALAGTRLVVPAGALARDETIRISAGSRVTSQPEQHLVGPAVTVEPHGLTFSGDGATLRIPYYPSSLPPGTSKESLAVLKRAADGSIHRLEVVGLPADGDFLEVRIGSLSRFQAVLTVANATGTWVVGSVGGEFDPSRFDIESFNLGDFDLESFDFEEFDFSSFDLADFDFADFDLSSLGEIEGLPIDLMEITQNTAEGTFEVVTNQTDRNGDPVKLTGTFDGPYYTASASYPGENGTEKLELEFEIYSDNLGVGTAKTTAGTEATTDNVGLVRAESLLEAPTFGPGLSRIPLVIGALSDPSDATLPGTALTAGSYSGTFVQLAADETTGLVIATYVLDSDLSNPYVGTVSGSEYLFFRLTDRGDGSNLIEILQLTRTSRNTFVPGTLGGFGFAWIYSDGGTGVNFGTGSARLGN